MIDFIWNDILINPLINGLIILSRLLFDNVGLAIIALTIIIRAATLPLTLRQLHASRRMSALTPKIQEIQKKYKDPKRRSEETMKLYKEEGVNPVGCLGPMIIQMPIWFALYAVLSRTVGGTPERMVELSSRLYSWSFIQNAMPLPTDFLWLDLGRPDKILPVLVFITTWLQTKTGFSPTQSATPQSAQMQQQQQMMLWMMPVMFAWFSIGVPSGLSLYWTVTNIIGIIMNYFVYGWRQRPWGELFLPARSKAPAGGPRKPQPVDSGAPAAALVETKPKRNPPAAENGAETRHDDAQSGNQRKERRRGGGQGAPAARTRSGSSRRRSR